MIQDIKLFGKEWAPNFFRNLSPGWRVRWMLWLNAWRWRLEVRVQWHAQYVLKTHLGDQAEQTLREEWVKDFDQPVRTFTERDTPSVVAAPVRELKSVEDTNKVFARLVAEPRSKRYARGRRNFVMYDMDPIDRDDHAKNTKTTV